MPDFDIKEKRFEQDIEEYLLIHGAPPSTGRRRWIPVPSSLSSAPASPSSGSGLRRSTEQTASGSSLTGFAGK